METKHKGKMLVALEIVSQGFTAYEAAKMAKVSSSTIYKSARYKQIKERRAQQQQTYKDNVAKVDDAEGLGVWKKEEL